jgi:hypothetical protein
MAARNRHRHRLRKLVVWGTLLAGSIAAGAVVFAYTYVTDGNTLSALIRDHAPKFFPGSQLHTRVQIRPFLGQIELSHIHLVQTVDGRPFPTAEIGWVKIGVDFRALLMDGKYRPREIEITHPTLSLCRRNDGSWNLQGLLADPWPAPPLETDPPLKIKNGTIRLMDADGGQQVLLRDVDLRARSAGRRNFYQFEGEAHGGPMAGMTLAGTLDLRTGRVELTSGKLLQANINQAICPCLPEAQRALFGEQGHTAGELDVAIHHVVYDPRVARPLSVDLTAWLHGGTLTRPDLPDTLTQIEAVARLANDRITIERAEAVNGKTTVRIIRGSLSAADPTRGPLDLHAEITNLELDSRLRAHTRAFVDLWAEYSPSGWVDAAARLVRTQPGEPLQLGLTVNCKDVGLKFKRFPYPLQHIRGTLRFEGDSLEVDVRTLVGGEWLTGKGTVVHPGQHATVKMDLASNAFPVDETLFQALEPEMAKIARSFHPAGTVRGAVHLLRTQPPDGSPERVVLAGEFDLNPGSSMRWDGMPYPVRDLSGHLKFDPNGWTFTDIRGRNGAAEVQASGRVIGPKPGHQAVELDVTVDHLAFEQQLRDALPPEWQSTWSTLNPAGECRVVSRVRAQPGQPPTYHLEITPGPETRIRITLTPVGPDGKTFTTVQLPPMEDIRGQFTFDDGRVHLSDVDFNFREAPVQVRNGSVVLSPTGQFRLDVTDLHVSKLRLDSELRSIMPPVMREFALRLDDGRSFRLRGDLAIAWSGQPGDPATCRWEKTTVVLAGNSVQTAPPIEHIQGQLEDVSGWSDGRSIETKGRVNVSSVHVAGQQITDLTAPVVFAKNVAQADDIRATVLGGQVSGRAWVTIESSPRYGAGISLQNADLGLYPRTLPGHQDLKGVLSARLDLSGQGLNVRTLTGQGWARVQDGDLGQLPLPLRWAKVANFRPPTRTAFDSAELAFRLEGGEARLDTIRLTGDAVSLAGGGTIKLQGDRDVDIRLSPAYGRDERRVPLVSNVMREATGRVFDIHVTGPLSGPTIRPEPLPDVMTRTGQAVRRFTDR